MEPGAPMNRRTFLTGAAASLAAPARIGTGILCIQHSHLAGKLKAMRGNPDYEVLAVCEPDDELRRRRAADPQFAGLRWMPMDELLATRDIDLIVFEGEVRDAISYGRRVLEAGKHLHLEKPPTHLLEPFRELVELARRRSLRLQLGYLWRFHAGFDAALAACRNGWLGDVYMLRATVNSDRDMEQRAVEARFRGGSMFELGGHVIDRIVALLGRPDRVRPWLRHDTSLPDSVNGNTLAVFEYANTLAVVASSNRDPAMHRCFEAIGSDGSVRVEPVEPAPTLRVQLRQARGPYEKGVQDIALPPQPRFVKDFEDLARAIKTGTPLKYSYDHELSLQETLLRASGELA